MTKEPDIYTGTLVYKDIEFTFVFANHILHLLPPKDKKSEISDTWLNTQLGNGLFTTGDPLLMDNAFLIGHCNETANQLIFITIKGSIIEPLNTTLIVQVRCLIKCKFNCMEFNSLSIQCPEINCIHPLGSESVCSYSKESMKNGEYSIHTSSKDTANSKSEFFELDGKQITVRFGSSITTSYNVNKPPITINSSMNFRFEGTSDYYFIYKLWNIAKQFIQYVCYRRNVYFKNATLTAAFDGKSYPYAATFCALCDEGKQTDIDSLSKGRFIKQNVLTGSIGNIFQAIADNKLYMRHIPATYEDGKSITEASLIILTAAFEWEFKQIFSDNQIFPLEPKKKVTLAHKITYACEELKAIVDPFGERIYSLNNQVFDHSEIGKRFAKQRNNFAHGNLDKDFNALVLPDISYLELLIYAMQLKRFCVDEEQSRQAISDLFAIY